MLEITYQKTGHLIPYANNPRVNDHAVDRAASLLREYGFRTPVLIKSDLSVIDGHLRLKAAKKLGIEEVPCSIVDDLTDTQIKALRIAINRGADLAEWDEELLAVELEALEAEGYDMELTGFDDAEIERLTVSAGALDLGADVGGLEDDLDDGAKLTCCPKCGFEYEL